MILPNNRFYRRAKLLRWYGIDRDDNRKDFRCENDIEEWGFKFHMNDINATIGLCNFKHIDTILEKHKENALYYNKELKGVKGVKVLNNNNKSSYWIYTIKVENQKRFMDMMEAKGIMVSRIHERNDKHSCVMTYKRHLPNLNKLVNEMICIPVGWWLSKEEREYIVECIKKGW